jgi:outer membrane protein OmpA-like peptidoglycan-associated protein
MKLPNAYMGNVYAGMGIEEEGEYLRGKFTKPLEKSMRYSVKLRVRLPIRFCSTPIDEIGVVITDSAFAVTEGYTTIDMPSLKLKSNDQSPIKDQYQWQEISAIYEAKGGETFIMIGNFKDNNVSNFKNRITEQEAKPEEERKKLCTYIYIDAVTVEEYKEITLKNYSPGTDLKKGDRLLLKDVEFETSLDKLKAESFPSLDALAKQLVDKATLRLEVSGHTDNTGDESTNRLFSKMRAEAVVNYLVGKGVKATQLLVEGKGSSMNIAQNNSEANKKKNRRTEIKVMEE